MKIKIGKEEVKIDDYISRNVLFNRHSAEILELNVSRQPIDREIQKCKERISEFKRRLTGSSTQHDIDTVNNIECKPVEEEIERLETQSQDLAKITLNTGEILDLDLIQLYMNISKQSDIVIEQSDLHNGKLKQDVRGSFLEKLPHMETAVKELETTLIKISRARIFCTAQIKTLKETKTNPEEIKLLSNIQKCLSKSNIQPYEQLELAQNSLREAEQKVIPKWYSRLSEIMGAIVSPPKGYTRFEAISGKQHEDFKQTVQNFKKEIELLKQNTTENNQEDLSTNVMQKK